MPTTNVELVRAGFAAATRGDLDTIADLLDPEVKWHGGDPESGCRNRGQALEWMGRAIRRGPGWLIEAIDAGSDRVVVILRPRGEPGHPVPPPRANVTTLRDGRVVEMVAYETPDDAWASVGGRPSVS